MTTPHPTEFSQDDRLLLMLQRLLAIRSPLLRPSLTEASNLIAETFGADKVDVFIHEPSINTLVAFGTSQTPMGKRQHELGLDRLPLANGGRAAWTFTTGEIYLTGHADEDPEELRGITEGLGIRSIVGLPIVIDDHPRGVLQVDAVSPDFFSERDRDALAAVASWVGMVLERAELSEREARAAERRGLGRAAEELQRITRRQQDVAACIAEGLSNVGIAQRLTLTEGTVANHVEAILRRLNLQSRTQIAVWAVERGLYSSAWATETGEADQADQRRRWPGRSVGGAFDVDSTDRPEA
jgi:DNA-binding CsgD family transcriptional regulator